MPKISSITSPESPPRCLLRNFDVKVSVDWASTKDESSVAYALRCHLIYPSGIPSNTQPYVIGNEKTVTITSETEITINYNVPNDMDFVTIMVALVKITSGTSGGGPTDPSRTLTETVLDVKSVGTYTIRASCTGTISTSTHVPSSANPAKLITTTTTTTTVTTLS